MKKLSEQLTVRLPEDEANEIEQIAADAGSNPTEILRMCVHYGLPRVRSGFAAMRTPSKDEPSTLKPRK